MAVSIDKNAASIENEFLKINFEISRSKIKSFFVLNKRTGEKIQPDSRSDVFALVFKGGLFSEALAARKLKIKKMFEDKSDDKQLLVFDFEPSKVKDAVVGVSLIYEICEGEHFLRKYLKITSDSPESKAVLDYIDFEPSAYKDQKVSCVPPQEKSHISGELLCAGQPVFAGSLFFGCEFPLTMNSAENGIVTVRYYSGKPVAVLTGESGEYISHKAVIGVCKSAAEHDLHSAFFEYIDKIAKPLEIRVQYNSWYDHMLDISAENIEQSFLEIEKGMSAVGTRPLDCFVVDDGWKDDSKDFWDFNQKFPNGLYHADALAKALGGSLGLWLGPRGGYTRGTLKFAKNVENGGNGFVNKRSFDVDIASEKYINGVSELMSDYQKKFDLKYWKLDGFAKKACRNSNHDHIVGGKNDMYFFSELWERWLKVFERLEKESDGGVFINLTSYAPPSPWFLQWVNSVWLQVSDDMGMLGKNKNGEKSSAPKKDMLLSYRDDRYYDFLRTRKFVFPQSRIYNHDPIYATEAKVQMSDEEFREYLFSAACRGNAFWELYYSPEMMNEEKWRINNSVLCFLRENFHLLKRSVMFGGSPALGQVYGFSAFDENEGIVMLRNAGSTSQNYVLKLDESIGVSEQAEGLKMLTLFPYESHGSQGNYRFNDTVNVMLSPYQTKILSFGKRPRLMMVEYVKVTNKNKLEVMFNQNIVADSITCAQNEIVSCTLLADYRSCELTFKNEFQESENYTLCGIKDIFLFENECDISFEYHENGIIKSGCVRGNNEFSIVATTGGERHEVLFSQGSEIELCERGGKIYFRVGSTQVLSNSTIQDVVQICAVRERNGTIKLYLNKHLDCGARAKTSADMLFGGDVFCFDKNKVKVYSRALSYTEV